MRNDDVLWAQVAARNTEAFEKFYNNHYPRVRWNPRGRRRHARIERTRSEPPAGNRGGLARGAAPRSTGTLLASRGLTRGDSR
jgi:hypothetical protein